MNGLHKSIRSRPVLSFFFLSIVISWPVWGLQLALPSVLTRWVGFAPHFGWLIWLIGFIPYLGPFIAAMVAVRLSDTNLRAWMDLLANWRVEPYWYAVGLILPLLCITGVVIAAALFFNGSWSVPFLNPRVVDTYVMSLILNSVFALGVEAGYRGFALPRLQHRYDALTASGLIAIAWAIWNLPLFVYPSSYLTGLSIPVYVLLLVAVAVFLTYIYNSTGGCIFVTALLSGGFQTSLRLGEVGVSSIEVQLTALAVWAIPALVVANLYGRERLAKQVPRLTT